MNECDRIGGVLIKSDSNGYEEHNSNGQQYMDGIFQV
jgi:hypothetical protein